MLLIVYCGANVYYDNIGLLSPSRSDTNRYRCYSPQDVQRLERILLLRSAGLPLEDIANLLKNRGEISQILEHQLAFIDQQIGKLHAQQRVILSMLAVRPARPMHERLSKAAWTEMFRAIGLSDSEMWLWHAQFEATMPDAHQSFLVSLGIDVTEAAEIRRRARAIAEAEPSSSE